MVKFPVAAFAAAPKMTCVLAPAAIEKGLEGLEVTPEGIALSVTCTVPEKPFSELIEMLTGELTDPCEMETEPEETPMVKSAGGGGGEEEEPPPQPAPSRASKKTRAAGTPCRNRPKECPCELSARTAGIRIIGRRAILRGSPTDTIQ